MCCRLSFFLLDKLSVTFWASTSRRGKSALVLTEINSASCTEPSISYDPCLLGWIKLSRYNHLGSVLKFPCPWDWQLQPDGTKEVTVLSASCPKRLSNRYLICLFFTWSPLNFKAVVLITVPAWTGFQAGVTLPPSKIYSLANTSAISWKNFSRQPPLSVGINHSVPSLECGKSLVQTICAPVWGTMQ